MDFFKNLTGLSNLARTLIAFGVLSIFLVVALSINDNAYAFTFFGGLLGMCSSVRLLFSIVLR